MDNLHEMKKCNECSQIKRIEQFYNGRKVCTACYKAKQNKTKLNKTDQEKFLILQERVEFLERSLEEYSEVITYILSKVSIDDDTEA
jgi:hypothetical protein